MKKLNFLIMALLAITVVSCINDEGEGGTSVVQGRIYKVMHYNNNFPITSISYDTLQGVSGDSIIEIRDTIFARDTFPAAKENVYIIYGNDPIYGDKMDTGYDGFFRFKYLTKGTYKVYAFSSYTDGRKEAVIDTVTVASGKTANTRDIYIHEGKGLEASYIKGRVLVTYFDKGVAVTGAVAGCDVRVYIRKVGSLYHFDETRTSSNGIFMFQGIAPGSYEVFVLTERTNNQVLTPLIKTITVKEKGVIVNMPSDFNIIINA